MKHVGLVALVGLVAGTVEAAPKPAVVKGTYRLKSTSFSGTLTIKSVSPFRYDLVVVTKGQSDQHGELRDQIAEIIDATTARATPAADCKLTFRFVSGRIDLAQDGECTDAGFGAFVSTSGQWRR